MSWKSGVAAVSDGLKDAWVRLAAAAMAVRRSAPSFFSRTPASDRSEPAAAPHSKAAPSLRAAPDRIALAASPTDQTDVYYAIGDIHGRADLVRSLFSKIV
ncbi:MAG: hypothetical protein RLN72_11575, partial [Henriciella sp.]